MTTVTLQRVDESDGAGVVIELDDVREARAREVIPSREGQRQPRLHPVKRRPERRSTGRRGPARCADSSPPTLHGGRLTRRGRLVVTVAWFALAAIAALLIARPFTGTDAPEATSPVQIEVGDTLWDVARGVDPQGDPREIVAEIVSINGLESAGDIRPGDVLQVPREG